MIAIVGQRVLDRIEVDDEPVVERLGGSPLFAAHALLARGYAFRVGTRGGDEALRAPLAALVPDLVVGPARSTYCSHLRLRPGGVRDQGMAAFGDPFTPADVTGWLAPVLRGARAAVCGAQWRDDFRGEALAALATDGRRVYLDAQGPARPARIGPIALEGPLDPALVTGVDVLKASEEEAAALLGGEDVAAVARAGIPVVVITRGERGATVHVGGQAADVGATPVLGLADTVGAGDAFLALMAAAEVEDGLPPIPAAQRACEGVAALLRAR